MIKPAFVWIVFAFGCLVLLAACSSVPCPPPAVVVKTVTIDRPIPVACVKHSDIPAMPPRVGDDLTGDAVHDLHVVAPYAIRLRAMLDQTLALLGACQ